MSGGGADKSSELSIILKDTDLVLRSCEYSGCCQPLVFDGDRGITDLTTPLASATLSTTLVNASVQARSTHWEHECTCISVGVNGMSEFEMEDMVGLYFD